MTLRTTMMALRIVTLLTLGFICIPTWAAAQPPSDSLPHLNASIEYRGVLPRGVALWPLEEGVIRHTPLVGGGITGRLARDPADRKSPFLAWFLSWLVPGGGQGYNGQWGKAAGFFGVAAVGFGIVVSNEGPVCRTDCGPRDAGLALLLAASVGSQIDAPITAAAINRRNRDASSARSRVTWIFATLRL